MYIQMSSTLKYNIKWKKWSRFYKTGQTSQFDMKYTLEHERLFIQNSSICFCVEFLIIFNEFYFLSLLRFVVEINTFLFFIEHTFRVQRMFICSVKQLSRLGCCCSFISPVVIGSSTTLIPHGQRDCKKIFKIWCSRL